METTTKFSYNELCECRCPEPFSVYERIDKTIQIGLKTFYFPYKCSCENCNQNKTLASAHGENIQSQNIYKKQNKFYTT